MKNLFIPCSLNNLTTYIQPTCPRTYNLHQIIVQHNPKRFRKFKFIATKFSNFLRSKTNLKSYLPAFTASFGHSYMHPMVNKEFAVSTILVDNTHLLRKGKYHCTTDSFNRFGFGSLVTLKLSTDLLVWLNPNQYSPFCSK